jgi:hypothetical protein
VGTLLFARATAACAALIALSAPPVAGASEARFGTPRSLTEVNGFAAAPAIAPDGRAVVAVSDYSAQRSRVLAYTRSARGRWAAPMALRTSRQELLEPRAAYTGDGTAVFTWLRAPRIDQEQVVESRRLAAGGTFGPVAVVSPGGERAVLARVAGGPGSRALIGWEDGDYSLHAGEAGGAFETIFARREAAFALAYLPDATAVALSQAYGAGGVQVRLRPDGAAAWGEPVTLSGARTAREATMAVGRDGTLAVAWAQSTDDGYRVQVAERPPGGTFTKPHTIAEDDGEARAPAIAVLPSGELLVAWLAEADLTSLVRGGEVRVATASLSPEIVTESITRRVSGAGRRLGVAPRVLVDDEGDTLIAWEESRRLMAAVRDGDEERFSAPRGISPLGARIFSSRVVANGRGDGLAAWSVDRGRSAATALIQAASLDF